MAEPTPIATPHWASAVPERERWSRITPRRLRHFVIGLVIALLLGSATGVATWYRPLQTPYYVPITITAYRDPLIPNRAAAAADRAALADSGLFPTTADTETTQETVLILSELEQLLQVPANQPLVVSISGYAVPSEDGDVALISADAEPPLNLRSVSIRRVLRAVTAAPARDKLLILDLGPPPTNPTLGFLNDDPAAAVSKLVRDEMSRSATATSMAIVFPEVLVSCEAGQQPHIAAALGRTIFGYYLEAGLQGAAAGWGHAHQGRRVCVLGLAHYLRASVDRWVRQNRGSRQTPILISQGRDFFLAAVASTTSAPEPSANPNPNNTPNPINGAIALLRQWRTDGSLSLAPGLYQDVQAALDAARISDQDGRVVGKGDQDLAAVLGRVTAEMNRVRSSLPQPVVPSSIAQAEASGQQPDASVATAARTLVQGYRDLPMDQKPTDRAAAETKLVQAFVKTASGQTALSVESALLQEAIHSGGRADLLGLIGQVFTARNEKLVYIETRFLSRLIDLAARSATAWNAPFAATALSAVVAAEQVAARPELESWAPAVFDQCQRARWEGEILLADATFAPENAAGDRFREAARLASLLLEFADSLQTARGEADRTLVNLLAETTWLSRNEQHYSLWFDKLTAARTLTEALDPPNQSVDSNTLQTFSDRIRKRTADLRTREQAFVQASSGTSADWLLQIAYRTEGDAEILTRLEAILTLPDLPAERRAAFEKARTTLADRLNSATLAEDASDNANGTRTAEVAYTTTAAEANRRDAAAQAAVVARCHLAVLALTALPAATAKSLEDSLAEAVAAEPGSPLWSKLASELARSWTTGLNERYASSSPAVQDTIVAIAPGLLSGVQLDSPPGGPRVVREQNARNQFFSRVAGWYLYAARAGLDPDYFSELAQLFAPSGPPSMTPLDTPVSPIPMLAFSDGQLTSTIQVPLLLPASGDGPPEIRVLVPDSSIAVTATLGSSTPDPAGAGTITPLTVQGQIRSKDAAANVPAGVVVELRGKDRSTFLRVPIDTSHLFPAVDLIVSRDIVNPVALPDLIRVRPGSPQNFFVFVRNRTQKPQSVELTLGGSVNSLSGATAQLTLTPGQTTVAKFTPAAPPPSAVPSGTAGSSPASTAPTSSIPLPASITITAADPKTPNPPLATRTIQFEVAPPFEYVAATGSEFAPASPPTMPMNQLRVSLKATQDLGGVPCVAELILDPKSIPGLRAVRTGRLAGTVPPGGASLILDATGIVLDPEVSPRGEATITVDGVARVFRLNVDFARSGQPTTPALDRSPYLALVLAEPPTPGRSVAFLAGADHAPPGSTVDVRLLRNTAGLPAVEKSQTFAATRSQQASFSIGTPGSLTINATIADWSGAWELPQVIGSRTIQARLLDMNGKVLRTRDLTVILDDSPPINVAFRDPPGLAKLGLPVTLQATGSDPESGITSVSFFAGSLVKGEPPATAIFTPAVQATDDPNTWTAAVAAPPTASGPTEFTVKVMNGAGLASYATTTVNLVQNLPVQPGAIAGQLLLGSAPQAGLTVNLLTASGKALKTATTDINGKYSFDGLAAGSYRLTAVKVTPSRTASATVQVTAGATTTQDLSLYLTANSP